MNPLNELHNLGQRVWLDDISREMLRRGKIADYIKRFSLTGLTSNPTIFAKAIRSGTDYDEEVRHYALQGETDEEIFFGLALADLAEAADLFSPVHALTDGWDGWVSLELSPLLAADTERSIEAATTLHARAQKTNLFIKIPGTTEGLPAIEEAIFRGVPVNVTLLFSAKQYQAAAEAWLRGVERRLEAKLDPDIPSVASIFVSRWDIATRDMAPAFRNKIGIAMAREAYVAYRKLSISARWKRMKQYGLRRHQRLLFASTSSKDPDCPDSLYVSALAAPDTIDTMPEKTLLAFAGHGRIEGTIPSDGGESRKILESARKERDLEALAVHLQVEGTKAFAQSWEELLESISVKAATVRGSLRKRA